MNVAMDSYARDRLCPLVHDALTLFHNGGDETGRMTPNEFTFDAMMKAQARNPARFVTRLRSVSGPLYHLRTNTVVYAIAVLAEDQGDKIALVLKLLRESVEEKGELDRSKYTMA